MEIKDVKIFPVNSPDGNLLAYASVVIGGVLKLNSFRIMTARNGGYFIAPPSRKYTDREGNTQYSEYYHPINKEFQGALHRAISDAYKAKLGGRQPSAAVPQGQAQPQPVANTPAGPPPVDDDLPF